MPKARYTVSDGVPERYAGPAPVLGSGDAVNLARPLVDGQEREHLIGIFLDRRNRPLAVEILSIGAPGYTVVDPRVIFRRALLVNATSVILAHNHPSGDPTPSQEDVTATRKVSQAGDILGIKLLDHVVIGAGGSWSRVPIY